MAILNSNKLFLSVISLTSLLRSSFSRNNRSFSFIRSLITTSFCVLRSSLRIIAIFTYKITISGYFFICTLLMNHIFAFHTLITIFCGFFVAFYAFFTRHVFVM
ncbi:unnamed protein product [Acanthoscelides obtectus]|uniref:Uncharacterized protein n=1 Tax=Acanthoscelides obtectus TaxID=200917 RepID=A0A9P0P6E0_ACAOB|nr:unnamed protein product [Acanthoscelides obtectus]CAK1668892.1 hypothetical protein AOBTE_LOCUS26667 [Acanthoscelides obtectus]